MCSIIPSDIQMLFRNIPESFPKTGLPDVLKEQDQREEIIQSRIDSTNPAFTEEGLIQEIAQKVSKISSPFPFFFSSLCTGYGISHVVEKTLMKFPQIPMQIYVGYNRAWILNPALETILFVRSAIPHTFVVGAAFGLTLSLLNELRSSETPEFYAAYAKGTGIGEKRMTRLQRKVELLSHLAEQEEDPALKKYYTNAHQKMNAIFQDFVTKRDKQLSQYTTGRFFLKQHYVFTPTAITLNGSPVTSSVLK